ncbi:hypothetical protein SUDANB126_00521 [Streptomyces sp. enrichment culture]
MSGGAVPRDALTAAVRDPDGTGPRTAAGHAPCTEPLTGAPTDRATDRATDPQRPV